MAVFVYTGEVDSTEPLGSRNASDIDNYIRNLKGALNERMKLEHYSIDAADGESTTTGDVNAQGRHVAGLVGCIGRGTYATMTALTEPGEGAFWIKTDSAGGTDAGTTYRYTSGAWVASQLATGTIYATAAEAIDGATTDKALSPATVVLAISQDTELTYKVPTAGTTALTKSVTGTYNYVIADFTGTGVDTDLIRGVYVETVGAATNGVAYVKAEMPDGTMVYIDRVGASGGGDSTACGAITKIPITEGQLDFDIEVATGTDTMAFTIVGLEQKTV